MMMESSPKSRRVPNAFMLFVKEQKSLAEKDPYSKSVLRATYGEMWRSLSDKEKQAYYIKYNNLKSEAEQSGPRKDFPDTSCKKTTNLTTCSTRFVYESNSEENKCSAFPDDRKSSPKKGATNNHKFKLFANWSPDKRKPAACEDTNSKYSGCETEKLFYETRVPSYDAQSGKRLKSSPKTPKKVFHNKKIFSSNPGEPMNLKTVKWKEKCKIWNESNTYQSGTESENKNSENSVIGLRSESNLSEPVENTESKQKRYFQDGKVSQTDDVSLSVHDSRTTMMSGDEERFENYLDLKIKEILAGRESIPTVGNIRKHYEKFWKELSECEKEKHCENVKIQNLNTQDKSDEGIFATDHGKKAAEMPDLTQEVESHLNVAKPSTSSEGIHRLEEPETAKFAKTPKVGSTEMNMKKENDENASHKANEAPDGKPSLLKPEPRSYNCTGSHGPSAFTSRSNIFTFPESPSVTTNAFRTQPISSAFRSCNYGYPINRPPVPPFPFPMAYHSSLYYHPHFAHHPLPFDPAAQHTWMLESGLYADSGFFCQRYYYHHQFPNNSYYDHTFPFCPPFPNAVLPLAPPAPYLNYLGTFSPRITSVNYAPSFRMSESSFERAEVEPQAPNQDESRILIVDDGT